MDVKIYQICMTALISPPEGVPETAETSQSRCIDFAKQEVRQP
jgi:hypothetical protein